MTRRPLLNKRIEQLEDMVRDVDEGAHPWSLDQIAAELRYRRVPRAQTLARNVERLQKRAKGGTLVANTPPNAAVEPAPGIPATGMKDVIEPAEASAEQGDPMIVTRLRELLDFVKQTALLRGQPPRTIEQHDDFRRYAGELSGLPGISFPARDGDHDEVWIRVERLREIEPPPPSDRLLRAVIAQSTNPTAVPVLQKRLSKERAVELGLTLPEPGQDAPTDVFTLDALGIREEADIQLAAYLRGTWQPWAAEEKVRRRSIALYADLFALHQKLQGNIVESELELVMGIGVAVWNCPGGPVRYPLITKLAELSVDGDDHAISVRPRLLEARVELDLYRVMELPRVADVARSGKQFLASLEASVNPFEASTFEPVLKTASGLLDGRGTYVQLDRDGSGAKLPPPTDQLVVTDTWALFARPRSRSLFVHDLERFESLLQQDVHLLPPAIASIVSDPGTEVSDLPLEAYRGLSNIDWNAGKSERARDLYFPMPYNDEQVQIVQMLDAYDGVVVQGPPGTGKTHTIANVICHYLANGKRVLVTSMKDPALAVLRDKLPDDIRALAISLLSSEADGMKQFEHAIARISAEVARINRPAEMKAVERLDAEVDQTHARIAAVDGAIAKWARKNLEPVVMDGEEIRPVDLAREVATDMAAATLIPDPLTPQDLHKSGFDDEDIVALRDARRRLADDMALVRESLPKVEAFPSTDRLIQAHADLCRLAELNAQVASEEVPALRDAEQQTIEAALVAAAKAEALLVERAAVDAAGDGWLSRLEARVRQVGTTEGLLSVFDALGGEVVIALEERARLLARPVEIPDEALADAEVVAAIGNLAKGQRPFGVAGLFGKSAGKQRLGSIRLEGMAPATPSDWAHVARHVALLQDLTRLLARWNALVPDLGIPAIATVPAFATRAEDVIKGWRKMLGVVHGEAELLGMLGDLFPAWADRPRAPLDQDGIAGVRQVLEHNLTRNRLASIWQVKDAFLGALDGAHGRRVDRIRRFLEERVGAGRVDASTLRSEWLPILEELRRCHRLMPAVRTVSATTQLIAASGAVRWAEQLRHDPPHPQHDPLLPDNWRQCWRLRRLLSAVQDMDGRQELERLSRERADLESALARLYEEAVARRTWLEMARKASPAVRSALEAYRTAIKRIGKGTGIRAPRFRKDAREAADKASPAVPCWIMPHYRICESLPVELGGFDLVIIDEASQSDLTALPAILRAKKVLIVGDDKQVSPDGVGIDAARVGALMTQHLQNQVDIYRAQMSPDRSIYDLFKVVFAQGAVMLREHFRCVEPIIEYSKREFYDHELRPLRVPRQSERLDPPLVDVHVLDGARGTGKTNRAEAQFIVHEIGQIVADPAMATKTIGVVSLLGSEQAKLVWDLVNSELGEAVVERHQLAFGDARTFQGKERDIMFLSMVVSDRPAAASEHLFAQRYNVAASRARDRMYLVRSVSLEDLSPNDVLRRRLIEHFRAPFAQNEEEATDLRSRCESPFERDVFDELVQRGYRVIPQVRVGSYRIDMVVEGENDARLAVECDGDRYHGPDQWDHDIRRQRVLERAGWTFWRCFASNFVLHRADVVEDLLATLQRHGIAPLGAATGFRSLHARAMTFCAFDPDAGMEEDSEALVAS